MKSKPLLAALTCYARNPPSSGAICRKNATRHGLASKPGRVRRPWQANSWPAAPPQLLTAAQLTLSRMAAASRKKKRPPGWVGGSWGRGGGLSHISSKTNCVSVSRWVSSSHPQIKPTAAATWMRFVKPPACSFPVWHQAETQKSENPNILACACVSQRDAGCVLGQVVSLKGRRRQNTRQRHRWLSHQRRSYHRSKYKPGPWLSKNGSSARLICGY